MKYERVDVGNVRGKTGETGQDGRGIADIRFDGQDGLTKTYSIIGTDGTILITFDITDGEQIILDENITQGGEHAVTGGTIHTALAGKSDTGHTHTSAEVTVTGGSTLQQKILAMEQTIVTRNEISELIGNLEEYIEG